jgi:hypothetical protein
MLPVPPSPKRAGVFAARMFSTLVYGVSLRQVIIIGARLKLPTTELAEIELHFRPANHLFQVVRTVDGQNRQAIRLCNVEDVIRRDDTARARHVLRDNVWKTGNIFSQVTGHQASGNVRCASRRGGDDQSNGPTVVKRAGLRGLYPGVTPSKNQQNSREKDPSIYTTIHRVAFVLLSDSAKGIQSFRRMEGDSGELGEC